MGSYGAGGDILYSARLPLCRSWLLCQAKQELLLRGGGIDEVEIDVHLHETLILPTCCSAQS